MRSPPPWKWWPWKWNPPPLPQAAAGVEAERETVPSAAMAAAAMANLWNTVVSPVRLDASLHSMSVSRGGGQGGSCRGRAELLGHCGNCAKAHSGGPAARRCLAPGRPTLMLRTVAAISARIIWRASAPIPKGNPHDGDRAYLFDHQTGCHRT